jgi:hypothetical protein
MIDREKITLTWIEKVSKENRNADKILTTLIKHDAKTMEKYNNSVQMEDWVIEQPLNSWLNKLKKSNPEAFFCWYRIYKLKTKQN